MFVLPTGKYTVSGTSNDEGKTVITFRTKRDIKNIVGAFSLDEKTNSVDLKKSLHK